MTAENGSIRITLDDVYAEVKGLREDVRASLGQSMENTKDVADHEMRVRDLERWKYALPPTLLLATGSLAVALFS